MAAAGHDAREAVRLRRCRMIFERALRDGISMEEARRRDRQDRWAAADRRLNGRLCGTEAPPFVAEPEGGRELAWFQR